MNEHLWWIVGAFCLTWAAILWTWWMVSEKASRYAARRLDERVLRIEKHLRTEPKQQPEKSAIEWPCEPPPVVPVTGPGVITIKIDGELADRLDKIEKTLSLSAVDAIRTDSEFVEKIARIASRLDSIETHNARIDMCFRGRPDILDTLKDVRELLEGMKKPARKPAKKH